MPSAIALVLVPVTIVVRVDQRALHTIHLRAIKRKIHVLAMHILYQWAKKEQVKLKNWEFSARSEITLEKSPPCTWY